MSSQFIQERSKKIFLTNYVPNFSPMELLSAAAGPLAALKNTNTGKKIWSIDKPLPLPAAGARALYFYAIAHYPVASIGGTVGLTLGAVPQGDLGIQMMAVLEESMGWDIGTAENIADVALVTLTQGMTARYPQHGGWAMTGGAWRYGHRFAAPWGVPAPPPYDTTAGAEAGDMPEDFFSNPHTARLFGAFFTNLHPSTLVNSATNALDKNWNLEFSDETIDGMTLRVATGSLVLPSNAVLYLFVSCHYNGNKVALVVAFADALFWSSLSVKEAMDRTIKAINSAMQQQFAVTLNLLSPPNS